MRPCISLHSFAFMSVIRDPEFYEAFDKIMGSNVKSNVWLCAGAIPQMAPV